MLRLNWRKIVVLVLISQLLIIYWSTLDYRETVRFLKEEQERRAIEEPVSAVPKPAPTDTVSIPKDKS